MLKKNVRMWLVFALVLSLVAVFAVGCPDEDEPATDPGEDPEDEAEEVVIGYTGPLSGPAAEYGEDCRDGVHMAIKELNDAGGITVDGQDYKFTLEALDDGTDPGQAVSNAERLRDVEDAIAVWNPVATTINPMLEVNEEPGAEFLVMGYTSTPEELEADNELVTWIPPAFTGAYVQGLGNWVHEDGWEDVAMLVTAGAYGDGWRNLFEIYWEEYLGGNIVADHPANYYEQTDFSTEITAIMGEDPDGILLGGPSAPTALVIEQLREMGYDGGIMIIDQAKINYLEEVMGGLDLLDQTYAIGPPEETFSPGSENFQQMVAEEFEPTAVVWEHALNFNAMIILARAMEEAGTVDDPHAIRDAMPDVFPILDAEEDAPLATEYFGIYDTGRFKGLASLCKVEDGEYEEVITNVWFAETEEEYDEILQQVTLPEGDTPDDHDFMWLEGENIYTPIPME